MQRGLTKDQITTSLRQFKSRRDSLLHDDEATFEHQLERFLEFCESDPLAVSVLGDPHRLPDVESWWAAATQHDPDVKFPSNVDEELRLRFALLRSVRSESDHVFQIAVAHNQQKRADWIEFFRTLIVRPFADELTHRIGEAANVATPEARSLQAVPLVRIPSTSEIRIFLSHKTVDKPLVYRYFEVLKSLGFEPWLDEANMPAGANLERELLRGFEESCAAVFFITDSFVDDKYLATEIDYAVMQKRRKEKKFAIVTLRYSTSASIPSLLQPYIYRDVANDLQGFEALLKALPIELGPPRWKAHVV